MTSISILRTTIGVSFAAAVHFSIATACVRSVRWLSVKLLVYENEVARYSSSKCALPRHSEMPVHFNRREEFAGWLREAEGTERDECWWHRRRRPQLRRRTAQASVCGGADLQIPIGRLGTANQNYSSS